MKQPATQPGTLIWRPRLTPRLSKITTYHQTYPFFPPPHPATPSFPFISRVHVMLPRPAITPLYILPTPIPLSLRTLSLRAPRPRRKFRASRVPLPLFDNPLLIPFLFSDEPTAGIHFVIPGSPSRPSPSRNRIGDPLRKKSSILPYKGREEGTPPSSRNRWFLQRKRIIQKNSIKEL